MKSIAEDLNFSSPGRTVDLSRKMIKFIIEHALDVCIEYRTLSNVVLTHCLRIQGAKAALECQVARNAHSLNTLFL